MWLYKNPRTDSYVPTSLLWVRYWKYETELDENENYASKFHSFFFRAVLILCLFNCFTLVSKFYFYFPPLWRLSWVSPYSWLQCETSMKKKIFSFSGWKCLEIASSVKCLECKTRLRHISIIYVLDGQNVNKQTLHISHVPFRRLCLAVPLLL